MERQPVFAQNAVLPITVVCGLVVVLGGFIWWMSAQNSKLETVVTDVKIIKDSLSQGDKNMVTHEQMRVYVRLLHDGNSTFNIPDWLR